MPAYPRREIAGIVEIRTYRSVTRCVWRAFPSTAVCRSTFWSPGGAAPTVFVGPASPRAAICGVTSVFGHALQESAPGCEARQPGLDMIGGRQGQHRARSAAR